MKGEVRGKERGDMFVCVCVCCVMAGRLRARVVLLVRN
jgi:hypothetical protein